MDYTFNAPPNYGFPASAGVVSNPYGGAEADIRKIMVDIRQAEKTMLENPGDIAAITRDIASIGGNPEMVSERQGDKNPDQGIFDSAVEYVGDKLGKAGEALNPFAGMIDEIKASGGNILSIVFGAIFIIIGMYFTLSRGK